jgi:hypothetical protein
MSNIEDINKNIVNPTRVKRKGRPKGSKNKKSSNSKTNSNYLTKYIIDPEKLFFFVKENTIPQDERNRFVVLCNKFAESLGVDTLTDTDVEEIALIYRDRIFMDLTYATFAEAGAFDTAMVNQVEKINKSLEVRKSNLGSRFIDRDKTRKSDAGEGTFLDLFNYYVADKEQAETSAQELKNKIEDHKKGFTSTKEYMENKLKNRSNLQDKEDAE